ncbi:MAG TPA: nucleoside triphosphate pyrophosphohydrolase [Firmicutes bacterium]|nr:nucleoside triphosphate pyrophosphohydrolase [Bacillota bacterium]
MNYKKLGEAFSELVKVTRKLRSEKGCPWDREQTLKSIRPYIIEEAYEVVESIDDKNLDKLEEELGDLIFLILFGANIAEEEKEISLLNVLERITNKMIIRHPHVFSGKKVKDSDEVLKNWEHIKSFEKKGVLDGVPKKFPALLKAFRMQEKAARVGFDWERIDDVKKKIREEVSELEDEIDMENVDKERLTDELGDLLFSIVNISRFLDINPEMALEETNKKFLKRFRFVEEKVKERGKKFTDFSLNELDCFWEDSKRL